MFRFFAIGVFWAVLHTPASAQESDADRYSQACEGGVATGCFNLGMMYRFGSGVSRDYARAADLYRQACEAGVARACSSLGEMHYNGRGVLQDYAQAANLYRQSCEASEMPACSTLGMFYYAGKGVLQNYVFAHALFNIAASEGLANAAAYRTDVQRFMTQQQISEAQTLARRCQEIGIAACLQ